MDLTRLQQKLVAAARNNPPGDRVPYAFEKRIMALIATRPVADNLTLWGQALWRAAASCVAVVLVVGACSFVIPGKTDTVATSSSNTTEELSQAFESTLLASVDQSATSPEDFE